MVMHIQPLSLIEFSLPRFSVYSAVFIFENQFVEVLHEFRVESSATLQKDTITFFAPA